MSEGNYIYRLFDIMQEFGEDTDIPYALIHDDIAAVEWRYLRHQDVDGMGMFYTALQQQGVTISLPEYQGAVPSTRERVRLAWQKFRMKTPSQVAWRQWRPTGDGRVQKHGHSLRGKWLSEAQTQKILATAKTQNITLNTWLLWSLNAITAAALTADAGTRAWGNTVNLRGHVPARSLTDNQSSIITVLFNDQDSSVQLHQHLQSLFAAGAQWGSWDFLSAICRFGPNLVRKQIRRYYSSNNSQMGTFSNLGVWNWAPQNGVAPSLFFCPPCTRTAPIAAAAATLNGRMSLTLGLHQFMQATEEQMTALMDAWVARLGEPCSDIIAPLPEQARSL